MCVATSPRRSSWSAEGIILFSEIASGLYRVSAQGGTPVAVTTLDPTRGEGNHRRPVFLPGGRRYLYLISGSDPNTAGIYRVALDTAERTRLVGMGLAPFMRWVRRGRVNLLFLRQRTLLAQRLDAERGSLTGEAFTVAEKVGSDSRVSRGRYSVAGTGLLTYTSGGGETGQLSVGGPRWGHPRDRRAAGRLLHANGAGA